MVKGKKSADYEVEKILDKKLIHGQPHFRIRWKGFDSSGDTWEPLEHLKDVMDLVQVFETKLRVKSRQGKNSSPESKSFAAKTVTPSKPVQSSSKESKYNFPDSQFDDEDPVLQSKPLPSASKQSKVSPPEFHTPEPKSNPTNDPKPAILPPSPAVHIPPTHTQKQGSLTTDEVEQLTKIQWQRGNYIFEVEYKRRRTGEEVNNSFEVLDDLRFRYPQLVIDLLVSKITVDF